MQEKGLSDFGSNRKCVCEKAKSPSRKSWAFCYLKNGYKETIIFLAFENSNPHFTRFKKYRIIIFLAFLIHQISRLFDRCIIFLAFLKIDTSNLSPFQKEMHQISRLFEDRYIKSLAFLEGRYINFLAFEFGIH